MNPKVTFGAFDSQYQRNNKTGGHKNLRCFPHCRTMGHVNNGFCGQPVVIQVKLENLCERNIMSWAMLCAPDSKDESLVKDQIVKLDLLKSRERSKESPLKDLLRGKMLSKQSESTQIVFNEDLLGWHYAWVSTRQHCSADHTFRVFITEAIDNDNIKILESFDSPTFKIVSRRRHQEEFNQKHTHAKTIKRRRTSEAQQKPSDVMASNRTTDRLLQVIFRFGNRFYNIARTYEEKMHSNQIRSDTKWKPLENLYDLPQNEEFTRFHTVLSQGGVKDVDDVMVKLGQLCSATIGLSRQHVAAEKLFHKWTAPENILKFFEQCTKERTTDFEWTAENEDETFDEARVDMLKENTIYGEFRQVQRDLIYSGLEYQGLSLEYFHKPMELASRHGFLFLDPFHPPDKLGADLLCAMIHHGGIINTTQYYGAGKSSFDDEETQKRYAKDSLLIRRGHFRNMSLNRIKYNHIVMTLYHPIFSVPPLSPIFDFNGLWINSNMTEGFNNRFSTVHDLQAGDLVTLIYEKMFARVKLVVSRLCMEFRGSPIFLGSGQHMFELDGRTHEVIPPMPLPLYTVNSSTVKPEYLAMLHEETLESGETRGYVIILISQNTIIPSYEVEKHMPEFYARCPGRYFRPLYVRYVCFEDESRETILSGLWEFLIEGDEPLVISKSLLLRCFRDRKFQETAQVSTYTQRYLKSVIDQNEEDDMANMLLG